MINIIPLLCNGCHQPIYDPYLLCIDQNVWHERCVTCSICQCLLHDKCLVRNQKLYCRNDYITLFGIRCKGCNELIQSNDSVLRLYTYKSVKNTTSENEFIKTTNTIEFQSTNPVTMELNENVNTIKDSFNLSVIIHYFHVNCFKCCDCNRLLTSGEEYTIKNCMPLCIMDYEKQLLHNESQFICTQLQFDKCIRDIQKNKSTDLMNVNDRVNEQQEIYTNDKDINCSESNRLITFEVKSNDVNNENLNMTVNDTNLLNDPIVLSDINISAANSSDDSSQDADRMDDDELYEMDSDSESGKNSKRPRTILTANQRRRFKAVFEFNPKPTRKIREALATETGLNIRVVQVWFQNQRAKIKKLARRHAQESRQQSNRRMFINNPLLNNEPLIRIRSPNSMLFNLRNPSIPDIPYLFNSGDECPDITSLQNNEVNENDPDKPLNKRMISSAVPCSPSFTFISQANQIENAFTSNQPQISTTDNTIEQSSFATHELFPCIPPVCTNSKSSSFLPEIKFTSMTSSDLMTSNTNENTTSNNNISSTNGSSIFDASINQLYSMQQSYFM
ncbi:hypothetical protein MN116_003032 [Schistosoma mekongi]|uniref:Uncharacterized protein n=1 Tax=Schistosoma mekongi TaxID=38744 RepID=A0AAE1ZHW7_SCHME|nr:hypothetical protein MN116_003032 [Schistosoma mekongi]